MSNSQRRLVTIWLVFIMLLLIAGGLYIYKRNVTHTAFDDSSNRIMKISGNENKVFGYISSVSNINGNDYLTFKQFKFLQGSAADAAAQQHGTCIPDNNGCYAANGYYIQGTDIATTTIMVSKSVRIGMATDCAAYPQISPPNMSVSFDLFKTFFKAGTRCSFRGSPYWIRVDNNGEVIQIDEQYRP